MGKTLDKIHREIQKEKLIKDFFSSEIYKQTKREIESQAVLGAYVRLGYFAAEYLEMNFHCKKEGISKMCSFLHKKMEEVGDDPEYFKDVKKYYLDTYGINVETLLGIEVVSYEDNE